MHIRSVIEARPVLRDLWASGKTIGSIHTLGALHEGHGNLIRRSAQENEFTIVTIYPNKIQLFPGTRYAYNLEQDVAFSFEHGATMVISSNDAEMYPEEYRTYIDQLETHKQLNSSVFPFATRGQVTGAIRWICLTRPTRSYFGMKDIEQALMVERAVKDLLIDCEIRKVHCIRYRNGIPISSRLMNAGPEERKDVAKVYEALLRTRNSIAEDPGSFARAPILMREFLEGNLSCFRLLYTTIVDGKTFLPTETLRYPFIIHAAVKGETITHFDGMYIPDAETLRAAPQVDWLDESGW